MTRIRTNAATFVLACAGAIDALLLTVEYFQSSNQLLPCTAGPAGCAGTLHSSYSHLGPIPISAFGLAMYLAIMALSFRRTAALRPAVHRELAEGETPAPAAGRSTLDEVIWGISFLGVLISWWLQYTSIHVLYSFCPYCFTSACLITLIFLLASWDYLARDREFTGEQKMLAGVGAFLLVMLGLLYVPQLVGEYQMHAMQPVPPNPSQVDQRIRSIVDSSKHMLGNAHAKYRLIEFADYGCPHCALAARKLPELLRSHPDVVLVYRNFPLGYPRPHFPNSVAASQAAEAAGMEGKFWPMHDYLFSHQKEVSDAAFTQDEFLQFARAVGITDVLLFQQDMGNPAVQQTIEADVQAGNEAHIIETPTFFFLSPDRATELVGLEQVQALLTNPQDPAWK